MGLHQGGGVRPLVKRNLLTSQSIHNSSTNLRTKDFSPCILAFSFINFQIFFLRIFIYFFHLFFCRIFIYFFHFLFYFHLFLFYFQIKIYYERMFHVKHHHIPIGFVPITYIIFKKLRQSPHNQSIMNNSRSLLGHTSTRYSISLSSEPML